MVRAELGSGNRAAALDLLERLKTRSVFSVFRDMRVVLIVAVC